MLLYNIRISFFASFFITILLSIGTVLGQNVNKLDSLSVTTKDTLQLQEVTINHSQNRKLSGSLTGKIKLHADELKTLPSLLGNTDLLKILEFTPGIQTAGDANSNLYVRGGDPGQNLLSYDGTILYTPGHILNFFPLFNSDHISTLELMKSGVNAEHGGFLSSVIYVHPQSDVPVKTSVNGSVGLLSSQATIATRFSPSWGMYASLRKTYVDLLLKPILDATVDNKSDNDLDDLGYDFFDANITVIGELSDNNKLEINVFGGSDDLDIVDKEILLDGYMKWRNITASAKLKTKVNETTRIEQSISYGSYRNKLRTYQADMYIQLLSEVQDFSYKGKVHYTLFNLPFETGVQYTYHDILPQDSKVYNAGIFNQTQSVGKTVAHDVSVFIQTMIRPFSGFYIEPGIRYTYYSGKLKKTGKVKDYQSVDFRLSARYKLSEFEYLRTGLSHNTQYVNKLTPSSVGLPTDFWMGANSRIKPQSGNEMSLGYFRVFDYGRYELSSDVYYRTSKDVTEFDQNFIENDNVPFTDKISYGKGRAYGWEIMLKKNHGKLTGWLSYSLSKAERKFSDINDGHYFPAKFDRTHELSVVAVYTFNKKWDTSLSYKYATGSRYTLPSSWYFINNMPVKEYGEYNGAKMPDYNRTDISVNYWYKKDSGINFSIYNVFMVNNPTYVFMVIKQDENTGNIMVDIKKKKLMTIIPSISWRFKF